MYDMTLKDQGQSLASGQCRSRSRGFPKSYYKVISQSHVIDDSKIDAPRKKRIYINPTSLSHLDRKLLAKKLLVTLRDLRYKYLHEPIPFK